MPYDKANPAHRQRVTERLARSRSRVPSRAVDTFIAVWNRVHAATNDEGKAFAAATGVVNRRFPSDLDEETHAALPSMAALAPVARALAVALGQRTLRELEMTLQNCDCGKDHARTLRMLQLAIQYASRAAGNAPPAQPAKRHHAHAAAGLLIPASAGYHARAETFGAPKNLQVKNVRYVWEVFAKHIYHNADKVFIAVREMLQNSRDAKAKHIQIEWIPEDPTNADSDGTIVFQDDGRGMDANKVENAFLAIGESGEEKRSGEEDQLGGFGAAKAAILTASRDGWSWEVRTRNVIARSSAGGSYQIGTTDDYVTGTKITLFTVRGGSVTTPLGWGPPEQRIRQLIATCDLRGLKVDVNGARTPGYFEGRRGRHGEVEKAFEDLDWGAFRPAIASYARPNKKGGALIVRVKGLAQFALSAPYGAHFERDWVFDFEIGKGVTPQTPEYPFNAGRDRFEPGSPAFYAFKRVTSTLEVQAATGTQDLGEYEELAPDATDPREQKAQAQFNALLDDVLGSDGFQSVLTEIVESSDEMNAAVSDALVSAGTTTPDESRSDRPGSRPVTGPPSTSDAAVVATLVESLLTGDLAEQTTRIEAFATTALPNGDLGYFRASLGRLSRSAGYAEDLAVVTRILQEAIQASAPTLSGLTIGAAVARILRSLERGIHAAEEAQVKALKRKGDINPFGNAACVFTHRDRFGVEAGREFRKKARKFMRHLVAWDFVVRAILTASNASATNSWYRIERLGVGFVLDPDVLGLTRKDGHFVMVNPLALDAIVETYRDRAFVVAVWLHAVACHEIAHAMQIQGSGSSAHNTDWSITRENLAAETLFLLPVIEDAVAKVLKLKRRRQRRAPPTPEQTDARVVRLETALAEAQTQIEEYKASATSRSRLLERYSDVAHRLQHLVGLYDFRGWLEKNPGVMAPYGFTIQEVLAAFDGPGSAERMMAMLDEMERADREPRAAAMRRAGAVYTESARSALLDLRGLGNGERIPVGEDRVEADDLVLDHAACPGCGGTCGGGAHENEDEEAAALRRIVVPDLSPPTARISPPA